MLSELSGFEAKYLDQVAQGYDIDFQVIPSSHAAADYQAAVSEALLQFRFSDGVIRSAATKEEAESVIEHIYAHEGERFCKPIMVSVPYRAPGAVGSCPTKGAHATTAYLLQRQDMLRIESVEAPFGAWLGEDRAGMPDAARR